MGRLRSADVHSWTGMGHPGDTRRFTEPEETAMDVADWLRSLGLERYEAAFRENDVRAGLLHKLIAEDLKELGVNSVGHRRELLEAIAALRGGDVAAGDPVGVPS